MSDWSVNKARDMYNIRYWSDGYFDINEQGELVVKPNKQHAVSLSKIVADLQEQGLRLPALLRFPDILVSRANQLAEAFSSAMQQLEYSADFLSVYPIKVNQQRHVVESLLSANDNMSLEAGSKSELVAVLGTLRTRRAVIVCNGYKDREFIRLALIGNLLGHRTYIIVEKLSEIDIILQESVKLGVEPNIGIRVRLSSIAYGKWQNTGGEKAKFGLSSGQVLQAVEKLQKADKLSCLDLLHFHLGSQIANIQDIQRGVQESVRYLIELTKLGCKLNYLDLGGGLGIDYEGTKSRRFCSINYSMHDYAHTIVKTLKENCQNHNIPYPNIITESGRAMTAHHALLVTDVVDVEKSITDTLDLKNIEEQPLLLQDLYNDLNKINSENVSEIYHDAIYLSNELKTLYTHGAIDLQQKALAEALYFAICQKLLQHLSPELNYHREIIQELNNKLADKLFCNFSLFQSLPDVWAIDQIFPIMPLDNLDKKPNNRVLVKDITCDSDGRIDNYVYGQGLENSLPLFMHDNLLLAMFLVGAYQETLGDIHNLFGDTDSAHVTIDSKGGVHYSNLIQGENTTDVLKSVNFSTEELLSSYVEQLSKVNLPEDKKDLVLADLTEAMVGYTYLER